MNLRLYSALWVMLTFMLLLAQFWLSAFYLSWELIHILTSFCSFCQMMPLLGYMFMLGKQAGGSMIYMLMGTYIENDGQILGWVEQMEGTP